ncbi:hypothetical protein [uncultured Draconibacterium sp.]|uniref:hypothetical protein n=1 Tax=uncultured Draconibacterium sp. TaxID=1573823 RepID=UPI002AA6F5E7|nr:hypothetical protein [uncultured Draconibacterium sp.]
MRKLKADRGIQGLIPAIVSSVVFLLILFIVGPQAAFNTLGGIVIFYALIFSFWSYYKSNNAHFLVSALYLITLGIFLILIDVPDKFGGPKPNFTTETKIALMFFYLFGLWLAYLTLRKKLKYRGREIMELAAWDVEEGPESYTERPRPAGETEYSKYDIIDFANYLKKILVCHPFIEQNRIVLVPVKMGDEFELLYKPDYDYLSKTWISFDFDGQVSVHISRKDYLDYKEDLAFDHLCESMGKLFITFADFYMRGDKVRILDRLNSVKLGIFS